MIEGRSVRIAAEVAGAHTPVPVDDDIGYGMQCQLCGSPWPCDTATLAIALGGSIQIGSFYGARLAEEMVKVGRAEALLKEAQESFARAEGANSRDDARHQVDAVRNLHNPMRTQIGKLGEQWSSTKGPGLWCECCMRRWPCDTAQAVYGEAEIMAALEGKSDGGNGAAPRGNPGGSGGTGASDTGSYGFPVLAPGSGMVDE